jgi:hypothetical protein
LFICVGFSVLSVKYYKLLINILAATRHSEKLLGAFPSHAHLAATSQPDEFVIKHYAGDVRLTSEKQSVIVSMIELF